MLAGPVTFNQVLKTEEVEYRATRLSHATIYETCSKKQVTRKDTTKLSAHRSFEMPQQVAAGIIMRQKHRDHDLFDLGVSVHVKWLVRLENRIGNTYLERMISNGGFFVPDNFVKERFTFFAADNIDFNEDTQDGKRTFHGTVIVMYQQEFCSDPVLEITLSPNAKESKIPDTVIPLLECNESQLKPMQPSFNNFSTNDPDSTIYDEQHLDFAIFFSKALLRNPLGNKLEVYGPADILHYLGEDHNTPIPIMNTSQLSSIPSWSALNSLLSTLVLPTTRYEALPLIASPAHEYRTLLTVLKQAQGINIKLMGPNRKTIITFDLGLYKPVKELQMSRSDLDDIIVRAGELHNNWWFY